MRASRRLHRLIVAAVALEEIDQAVGRGIVVLARLLARLLRASSWRAVRAPATWRRTDLATAAPASTGACAAPPCAQPRAASGLGDQLIDEAHAARGAKPNHRARQHVLHGGQRAGLADGARGAVEAGEDAELDLGEAELVPSSRVAMR